MRRFEGKTVLVTGGNSGIGAATARRIGGEGGRVIIAARGKERAETVAGEIRASGGDAWFQYVDLADPDSIAGLAEEVAERIECLDGLVNNAAIGRIAYVAETSNWDWEPQITINLRAPALCAKVLLPLLKKGPGHIVNVSSEGAFRPRLEKPNMWVYDASKAGLGALTRNLACEVVEFGMRVNTVAPGWTVTEMHYMKAEDPMARKAELENLVYDGAIIRRLARPEEVAAVIAFLLSDDASFITGTTIHVDGGRVAN